MEYKKIKLDHIEQNENSRVVYKTADLSELMQSMKKDGLLQPIGLKPTTGKSYEAVWGNRRLLAAKKLGWKEIDAHIVYLEDDCERDFVGLVENMKRQNTTVAEDGRIFQSLVDRGFNKSEIAVRLNITEERVALALGVFNEVPEEFRAKVVYTLPGDKRSLKNRVAASTAMAILNTRKTANLNRAQTRDLFAYAADKKPSIEQIGKIAPLIKSGVTIDEAIEQISNLERVVVSVYLSGSDIAKLEDNYGKRITQVFSEYLQDNKEFKIRRFSKGGLNVRKYNSPKPEYSGLENAL